MSGYFWYCCEVDIFHIGITEFFNPKLKTAAVFYETIKFKNKICFRNHQKKIKKPREFFPWKSNKNCMTYSVMKENVTKILIFFSFSDMLPHLFRLVGFAPKMCQESKSTNFSSHTGNEFNDNSKIKTRVSYTLFKKCFTTELH